LKLGIIFALSWNISQPTWRSFAAHWWAATHQLRSAALIFISFVNFPHWMKHILTYLQQWKFSRIHPIFPHGNRVISPDSIQWQKLKNGYFLYSHVKSLGRLRYQNSQDIEAICHQQFAKSTIKRMCSRESKKQLSWVLLSVNCNTCSFCYTKDAASSTTDNSWHSWKEYKQQIIKSQPRSFYWVDTDVFHFSLPITNADTFALLKLQLKDITVVFSSGHIHKN